VFEEKANKGRIEIFDAELGGHFAESFFGKVQKQAGSNRDILLPYADSLGVGAVGDR
jgi:hypothetical protein